MRHWVIVSWVLVLGFFSPPALGQDTGTVIGEGARVCKKFFKASRRKENEFIIWVQGFFSAYNAIAPDITNIMGNHDFHWVKKRLKTFCQEHPDAYFNDAVRALIEELHPQGIQLTTELKK